MNEYIRNVLSGKIPSNIYIRQAVERHERDLSNPDLEWDQDAADHALAFFPKFLRHSKGELAGSPFILAPWQRFVVGSLFGWKTKNGLRRFRTAYVFLPRKNGKSTLAAGIALYMLTADREPGAEVYTAATKSAQARIVFEEMGRMVRQSPGLKRHVKVLKHNINVPSTFSFAAPIPATADKLDGLNSHCNVLDEVHAHKNRDLWDALNTGMGSRRQALQLGITTAGKHQAGLAFDLFEKGVKILDRALEDDTFFCYLCCPDPDDDWRDRSTWIKANPNWDHLNKKEFTAQFRDAQQIPSSENAFRIKRLNQWVGVADRWLHYDYWRRAGVPHKIDTNQLIPVAALDLSSTTDFTAYAEIYDLDFFFYLKVTLWYPLENLREAQDRDNAPYDLWVRQGWIRVTNGNVVDYDRVEVDLKAMPKPSECAFDRWNSSVIVQHLMANAWNMVQFGQGYASMSPASKAFQRLLLSGRLKHEDNPVLNWMISNTVMRSDEADNIKPDKRRSRSRIDGVVAAIMAVGRADIAEPPKRSAYEDGPIC